MSNVGVITNNQGNNAKIEQLLK